MMSDVKTTPAPPVKRLYQSAIRAMWTGLAVNLGLAVVKLFAGLLSNSIAMAADAANSVGDALTSGVTIYALHYAQRPADRNHPYGHGRIEAIAALTVSVLIGATAFAIGVEALRNLNTTHDLPPTWILWVAAANIVIKEAVFRYKRVVYARTGSHAVLANAWDHRSDALCSAAVLVGLAIIRFGGPSVIWADEVAAIVVAVFILASCIKLYRRTASSLMDEQCDATLVNAIRSVAAATPDVCRIEKVYARPSGLEVLVDIHVEVDKALSVDEGHRIGHDVQERVLTGVTAVTHVLVHVEPARESAHDRS